MDEIIEAKKELRKQIEGLISEFMTKHGDMDIDLETMASWDGNKEGKQTYHVKVVLSI